MAAYKLVAVELEDAIANGTSQKRVETLRRITDLFVGGADQFSDEHVELFDEVITRLRPKLAKVPGATLYLQAVQDVRLGGRISNAQYQFTLQSDDLPLLNGYPRLYRDYVAFLEANGVRHHMATSTAAAGAASVRPAA